MADVKRLPRSGRQVVAENRARRMAEEAPLLAEIEALKQKIKQGESAAAERMRGSHGEGLELPELLTNKNTFFEQKD